MSPSPTPAALAARYDDVHRTSNRLEIPADRFDRALERGDDGGWGVGALVVDDGSVLMVREADTWLLPGGRLAADETPAAGARREVREETGLEVEITGLGAIAAQTFRRADGAETFEFYFATFLADPVADAPETAAAPDPPDEAIDDVAWHDRIPTNTFDRDLVVRLVETYG